MMLTFRNGSTESQTVMILITDDTVVEGAESFTVSLTTSENNVTIDPSSAVATVNIEDNSSEFRCTGHIITCSFAPRRDPGSSEM